MHEPSEYAPVLPRHATGWLLQTAHRQALSLFAAELTPLGLTPSHFGVLLQLALRQPLSQRQLADALAVDRTAMVRLLDDLEGRGLVERRQSPVDRRVNAIVLTVAGRRARARASAVARGVGRTVFGVLSTEELAQFDQLLRKIVTAARDTSPPTAPPTAPPTGPPTGTGADQPPPRARRPDPSVSGCRTSPPK